MAFYAFFMILESLPEVFPCLIFIGIGAMTDFTPLLENPKILLLGAAGQFGIFITLLVALGLGFNLLDAATIGIIGACDGPTSIYVASKFAPHLLGAVSVAAYSYMSLVPLLQPPIMKLLTTEKERKIRMPYPKKSVSKSLKILFPIGVTILTCLIAPMGTPLMGMLMLGNLMKESGVVSRLTNAAENEIPNIVTLLLGLSIGATMDGASFLNTQTLTILALGLGAICLDTVNRGPFWEDHVCPEWRQDQSSPRSRRNFRLSHGGTCGDDGRPPIRQEQLAVDARHGRQHGRPDRLHHGRRHHALRTEGHGPGLAGRFSARECGDG